MEFESLGKKREQIEYLEPPLLMEMLAQQRLILEMHKELLEILSHPPIVYKSEVSNGV